ncbi:ribosomal RNA processing protein 1 homolog B-like isoform X1 [Ornithodoros turicata]|uniref:ribosomal RNA processing protein 1 homolog B-like isoform X1 n=1 Tax=Ornithodoros turicata TaxID=34597 RepID=UPI0031394878
MPVVEEVNFAYHLASNEPNVRRRTVSKLMKWISTKSAHVKTGFTEESMMKLWKGLFYCMWMTDKPLVQQEMADSISALIHSFRRQEQTLMFIDAFFKTMAHEWFAIDRYRLDKFMMLVRRFFRQSLVFTRRDGWTDESIQSLNACLSKTVLHPSSEDTPVGLKTHIADIFLQELARMHGHELTAVQSMLFLEPFFEILVKTPSVVLRRSVRDNIFHLIIDLDPGTSGQAASVASDEDEEELVEDTKQGMNSDSEEEHYEDGKLMGNDETSVDLPAVPFDYEMIANRFVECSKIKKMKAPNRSIIANLVKKFWELSQGVNPLHNIDEDSGSELEITDSAITEAAQRLKDEEEKELMMEREELAKLARASAKSKGGKFGLDTCSGIYEHQTMTDSSESGSDADTESADEEVGAVQAKKKLKQSTKKRSTGKQSREDSDGDKSGDSDMECIAVGSEEKLWEQLQVTKKKKKKRPAKGEDDDMYYEDVLRHENQRLSDLSLLTLGGETGGENESTKKPKKRKKVAKVGSAPGEYSVSTVKKRKVGSPGGNEDPKEQVVPVNESSPGITSAKKRRRKKKKHGLPTGSCDARSASGDGGEETSSTESMVTKDGLTCGTTQEAAASKALNIESKKVNKRKSVDNQNTAKGKKVKGKQESNLNVKQLPTSEVITTSSHSPDVLKTTAKAGQRGLQKHQEEKKKKRRKKLLNLNDCENAQLFSKGKGRLQPEENSSRSPLKEAQKPIKTGPQSSGSPSQDDCGRDVTKLSSSPSQKSLEKEDKSTKVVDTIYQSGNLVEENAEADVVLTPKKGLKIRNKFAQFGSDTPTAKFVRRSHLKAETERPKLKKKAALKRQSFSDSLTCGKKVNFLLSRNRAQDPKEYLESLKASPQIPFDASKKPVQGVLKVREHSKQDKSLKFTPSSKRRRASDFF